MKQDIYFGMKVVKVNLDYMQLFVIIKNVGIRINGDVNVKNWLGKIYVMMDFLINRSPTECIRFSVFAQKEHLKKIALFTLFY